MSERRRFRPGSIREALELEPLDNSNDTSTDTDNRPPLPRTHLSSMLLKRPEMNALIMDYLMHEGYKEAAEAFREEAGLESANLRRADSPADSHYSPASNDSELEVNMAETMDRRIEIRRLIEEGHILEAQSLINKYYPELLDDHKNLYFKLQQQHLIELIRQQKINDVLAYVHDQLSVEELRDLTEMERTLALLAYEQPDKSPYAGLLKPSHRLELASEINDTILQETTGNMVPNKPKLVVLMKLLFWTQSELERKKIQYPKIPLL